MPSGLTMLALAGMGKQNAFITGVAASQPLYLISENLKAESGPMSSEFRHGRRAVEYLGQLGMIRCGGPLVEQLRYLLTTDPAHILLEQTFGKARGHVYRNLTRESWVPLRVAAADNVMLAFSFTPAVTASAGVAIRLRLRRRGNLAAGAGNVQAHFDGDAAGNPDEAPLTNGSSATIDVGQITKDDNGQEVEFTFATSPTLTASVPLHGRLVGTYAAGATDNIEVAVEDVASGGNFEIKDAAWANDATKNMVGRILTTSFTDSFLMADTIEGLSATLAIDKQVAVHEYLGMKVQNCTLRSTPADGLRATYDVVGYDEDQTPITTAGVLAGLKTVRSFPLHQNLTLLVGDQVDALAGGDAMAVDSLEIRHQRPLDQVFVSAQRQALEPLENGAGRVVAAVSLPRYAADTWRTWQNAGTQLQVKAQWTFGGKFLTALLPNVLINGQVEIQTGGNAPYNQKVELMAYRNGGANGFMAIEEEAELNYLA